MGREEIYNSVSTGIMMLGLYFNQVIEDQGLEKALNYWNKVGNIVGSGTVATLKEKFGDETPTPEALKEVLSSTYTRYGMDFEMETTLDSINIKVHRCPIYHGLSMAGFENSVINQFCHSGGGGEYAAITSVFPKLEPYAVPRKSADDVCIEGYKIKK